MGGIFDRNGWGDREVKVRRNELLEALRKNRENHLRQHQEACIGYRVDAQNEADRLMNKISQLTKRLAAGENVNLQVSGIALPVPVSHEKAYDQAIRMMEMSVDDEILLTSSQFACFVMDDWEWRNDWNKSNEGYLAISAVRKARGR